MVTCVKCQRTLRKDVCAQWVGHNNEGDGHWDCIPCIKKESYLQSKLLNGYTADSVYMLAFEKKKANLEWRDKTLKAAHRVWQRANRKLNIQQ